MTANAMEGDRQRCMQVGMDDYISKPVNPGKLHEVLAKWLLRDKSGKAENEKGGQTGGSVVTSKGGNLIDLAHLELFTEGDLDQEKVLSDVFFKVGDESLNALKAHLKQENTDEDWKMAAHKLKGSSAQIGAKGLSSACLVAETGSEATKAEKGGMLHVIEQEFQIVREFFEGRQAH